MAPEIESGRLHAVLARPLSRTSWLAQRAGTFAGIMELVGTLLDNETLERIGVAVSLVMPSDALWRAASYYLQSPAYVAVTSTQDAIPFAGRTAPGPALVAWALAYAVGCWVLADRWFRRRDLWTQVSGRRR